MSKQFTKIVAWILVALMVITTLGFSMFYFMG